MFKLKQKWKKCPKCEIELSEKHRKLGMLDGFALSFIIEILTWGFVILLLIFFSVLNIENLYGAGVIFAILLLLYLSTFIDSYHCANCGTKYNKHDLKKEYNKSLKHDTPPVGGAP
jgi:hypothetical protein